eukprot:GFYU01001698.1.p2 GENE.GFYU01001698.1~~GFYU01001698.1.p2  ORF type:complete len:231 (+),score=69.82 GFYU01001698.1:74-766(+)
MGLPQPVKAVMAEFVATMLFQLFGGAPFSGPLGNGFALVVLIYAVGHISGGHLNPVVSFCMMLTGLLSPLMTVLYMLAQLLGAMVGAGMLHGLIGETKGKGACTLPKGGITAEQAMGWECMMTFALLFVIYATAVDKRGQKALAPLAIGMTLYVAAASGGAFTGGALNPARTLGPAVVFNCWDSQWAYWIGQFFGGVSAAFLYKFGFMEDDDAAAQGEASPAEKEPIMAE